jgi:hypothetical protein
LKKSSPPSRQRSDAEAPRRLSPATLNLACLHSGQMRKREGIAIAEHVFAFEPTDPYALEGKVNGHWTMGDLKAAELDFAKPGFDPQQPSLSGTGRRNTQPLQPR